MPVMTDNELEHRERSSPAIFVLLVVGLPLLLFAPLILSFIEHFTMGTDHVEQFCRDIGIHGLLSKIYRPFIKLIEGLL
jgi:hypothetical protein